MTNLIYLQLISVLLCLGIVLAMLYTHSVSIVGLAILLIGIYYFSNKNGIDSIFVKVSMGIIGFVIIVSTISLVSTTKLNFMEFSLNLLKPNIDLSVSPESIPSIKIKKPDSPKYTYAFSVYLKDDVLTELDDAKKKYLFCRMDNYSNGFISHSYSVDPSRNTHGRNIGLRLGNNQNQYGSNVNDFATLYLDYATEVSSNTTFYTTPIYLDFPTKKWIDVVISVDKNLVNIYIDGKQLTKQVHVPNLKTPSASNPIEFGSMNAYLANFHHSPETIKPSRSLIDYLTKVDGIGM